MVRSQLLNTKICTKRAKLVCFALKSKNQQLLSDLALYSQWDSSQNYFCFVYCSKINYTSHSSIFFDNYGSQIILNYRFTIGPPTKYILQSVANSTSPHFNFWFTIGPPTCISVVCGLQHISPFNLRFNTGPPTMYVLQSVANSVSPQFNFIFKNIQDTCRYDNNTKLLWNCTYIPFPL